LKQYEDFRGIDGKGDDAWARIFVTEVADTSCGLVVVGHHFAHVNEYFNPAEEASLAIVSGGSFESAMKRANNVGQHAPIPAVYRRLSRLFEHGEMTMAIKDTLAERGLLRAVAYAESDEKPVDTRLAMFDRAGFRKELRAGKLVRILDLE